MVKVKEHTPFLPDGTIDVESWLMQLFSKGYDVGLDKIRKACNLSQMAGLNYATETGESCFKRGLEMADVLADLDVDIDTITAAILYEVVHYAELSPDMVEEQFGPDIIRLVSGIEKMSAISNLQSLNKYPQSKHQVDNVRKMLLAMVDDVRVVLIKLAEQLCMLRFSASLPKNMQKNIAAEIMEIYAPLANRLGIGALKWEMEDLAFRYLHPEDYKAIAKGLKAKRLERDKFVNNIVESLNHHIQQAGIHQFAVYGRSKHIHSIYRKMKRKNVELDQIFDATAVRVLVETQEECYEVLGLVHALWKQVAAEFDDYIVNPKPNGYQSLHTAVESHEGRVFEVQIRTFNMHELAEMGVAAHWKYKEGGARAKQSHERKIEWLREVLAWHQEMASNQGISENIETEFLEDRVYVFTPDNDVLDLPKGVTPLDFAYYIHSEIGHRCRGAKINGHIVPLTYTLKTGDKVEILTGKEAKPSRDWINPQLNYLNTPRAKAKVIHWFKMQDFDKHRDDGRELLEKELKSIGVKHEHLSDILSLFNFKNIEDLYAAIGRGDIKISQIIHRLAPSESEKSSVPNIIRPHPKPIVSGGDVNIEGVGNLLTHISRCCQPVPGDEVIGYITLGRGVSVHRKDCSNITNTTEKQKQRLLDVSWERQTEDKYVIDILIKAYDRSGLLRDINALLANEKTHCYALQTQKNKKDNTLTMTVSVEIESLIKLSRLLSKLKQIPNVTEAKRFR